MPQRNPLKSSSRNLRKRIRRREVIMEDTEVVMEVMVEDTEEEDITGNNKRKPTKGSSAAYHC